MIEKTLVIVKPDGVERQLVGRIIQRFEDVGLKIIGMKMTWVDAAFSKEHYAEHVEKSFYKSLEAFLTEGPVVALALQGVHAVQLVRKMVGSTEPSKAQPGTIRGDFAHHSTEFANESGKAVKNLIHASATKKDAETEIRLWFKDDELHDYDTVHTKHVF